MSEEKFKTIAKSTNYQRIDWLSDDELNLLVGDWATKDGEYIISKVERSENRFQLIVTCEKNPRFDRS